MGTIAVKVQAQRKECVATIRRMCRGTSDDLEGWEGVLGGRFNGMSRLVPLCLAVFEKMKVRGVSWRCGYDNGSLISFY